VVPPGVDHYPQTGCADFAALSQEARVAEARRLLAAAGFSPQKPLTLRFRVNNSDTQRRIALAVSAMWQPLGVRTNIVGTEMKAHQQALAQGDFDVARGAWYGEDRDALSYLRLLDGRSPALNISGYASAEYERLLDRADASADLAARAVHLQQAESLAMREQPVAPIHIYVSRRLVSPRIEGWQDNPRGLHLNRYLSIRRSTSSIHSPAAPSTIPARRP
jgi:ABC-type oligopeptide transport system substrate-binding subunit